MDDVQSVQEEEYAFPYHYLPRAEQGEFRWWPYWAWGYRYLSGIELVLDELAGVELKTLVDIGCGDGRFLKEAARRFAPAQLLGIDYSGRAIRLAQALNPKLRYLAVDITSAPAIGTFDAVTLIEVLEHIPPAQVASFVEGLKRLMHSQSTLIVTVPHKNQALIEKHYQHFDATSLELALGEHFKLERLFYFDRRCRAVALWQRLLFNRYFVIRHQRLLNYMYRRYRAKYLRCTEEDCSRMGAVFRVAV
jgi:2-polyprenyl-3-methyl-5-hydroxy-6-metoxy-1,4-benzoquinol methylase